MNGAKRREGGKKLKQLWKERMKEKKRGRDGENECLEQREDREWESYDGQKVWKTDTEDNTDMSQTQSSRAANELLKCDNTLHLL